MSEPAPPKGPTRPSVVTVGTYDGVHLGHQRLIRATIAEARARRLPAVIVTFDRLPAEVVRPDATPRRLTGLEHKLELLDATGADEVVVLHFDEHRAAEAPEEFVADCLLGELGATAIFVGTNFRFGRGATGDVALLERLAPVLGFSAHGVPLLTDDDVQLVVSSTRIRSLVESGELTEAAKLLGRPHEVRGSLLPFGHGVVVPGSLTLPPAGTYAVEIGPPGAPGVPASATLIERDAHMAEVVVGFDLALSHLAEESSGAAVAVRFV